MNKKDNNKKILIFGAGSIGNHFSYAATRLKYEVYITDKSKISLKRMKNIIYPQRYGQWNSKIIQTDYKKIFSKNKTMFDLVIIGTPPSTHLYLLSKIYNKIRYKKILIEKPLASIKNNFREINQYKNQKNLFCGYNHSVSESFLFFLKKIQINRKKIKFAKVYWQENWDGILNAHFWLKDEYGSYLGNYLKGGGALQEHSHGVHVSLCILEIFEKFKNLKLQSKIIYKKKKRTKYDIFSFTNITGLKFNLFYQTDLIKKRAKKSAEVYGDEFQLYWMVNYKKNYDAVIELNKKNKKIKLFKKSRSTEFENELKHIFSIKNEKQYKKTNLNLDKAKNTLKIIKKIFSNDKK